MGSGYIKRLVEADVLVSTRGMLGAWMCFQIAWADLQPVSKVCWELSRTVICASKRETSVKFTRSNEVAK